MSEIERLQKWMDARGLTVWDMARELNVNRVWVYRMVKYSSRLSDGFKVRFAARFGSDQADTIFDPPPVNTPETA